METASDVRTEHVPASATAERNRPAFEKAFASVLAEVRNDPSNTEKENPA